MSRTGTLRHARNERPLSRKKSTPLLLVGLAAASVVLGLVLWLFSTNQPVSEISVAEDLEESVRFISTSYRDEWGYNIALMRKLLKRAYEEFDEARIEVAEPPAIQINGSRAVIQAAVRVTALYQGHRNYLLGDQNTPNHILLRMERTASGWKMSEIKGLRPLGFEERFFRLLGAGVGLTMTAAERQEEQKVCMPCRERMTERFGLRR